MAHLDLKKAKKVPQTQKDIVYGYIRNLQSIFPFEQKPYFTIVQLIQDLILLYFHALIETEILTEDEQSTLIDMVHGHLNEEYSKFFR